MAGNVMIFVAPGTEASVLTNLATRLTPAGLVVAGFQLLPGRLTVDRYDEHVARRGPDAGRPVLDLGTRPVVRRQQLCRHGRPRGCRLIDQSSSKR